MRGRGRSRGRGRATAVAMHRPTRSVLRRLVALAAPLAVVVSLTACESKKDAPSAPPASADNTPTGSAAVDLAPPAPSASTIPAPPDVAAPPADAQKTPSGLASKVITSGTG